MSTTVFKKPECLLPVSYGYCPGCGHGIITTCCAKAIDDLGLQDKVIHVSSVGCGGLDPFLYNTDVIIPMHGRAPATATGIKRMQPDKIVWTYQGDGDLASIGTAEIVHAAHRGEKITTVFINNTTYGMTGGQMAPTTLVGQKTTTSPYGRDEEHCGKPIRMSEMLATIDGAKYIARCAIDTPAHIRQAQKCIKRAFECQMKGLGFAMVEVLSTCPTNWGMTPADALKWQDDNMIPYFPLGVFKDFED